MGADVTAFEVYQGKKANIEHYFSRSNSIELIRVEGKGQGFQFQIKGRQWITQPNTQLEQLIENFTDHLIPESPCALSEYVDYVNEKLMPYIVNVSESKFIGHMTSALPDFMPEFSRLIAMLNQNMVKVETSKSLSLLERQVLAMTHQKFFTVCPMFFTLKVLAMLFGLLRERKTPTI